MKLKQNNKKEKSDKKRQGSICPAFLTLSEVALRL
jgi:hypothetical protein